MPITLTGDTGVTTPALASAGMPTSGGDPVVESGSNSDGWWVRWADGTQKCWEAFSAGGAWTYPVPFVGGSAVIPGVSARNNVSRWATVAGVSTTGLTSYGWEGGGSSSTPVDMHASGQWK